MVSKTVMESERLVRKSSNRHPYLGTSVRGALFDVLERGEG